MESKLWLPQGESKDSQVGAGMMKSDRMWDLAKAMATEAMTNTARTVLTAMAVVMHPIDVYLVNMTTFLKSKSFGQK